MSMRFFSGEFLLDSRPNGGTAVFVRSLWITAWIYVPALLLRVVADPESIWGTLSLRGFLADLLETLPWAGAVFAGAYAGLYSRFSSQWTYLAGLYNQILQSQATATPQPTNKILDMWWAGFVEDAMELHLASKPMFAVIIHYLFIERPSVKEVFKDGAPGGAAQLAVLENEVKRGMDKAKNNWETRAKKMGLQHSALAPAAVTSNVQSMSQAPAGASPPPAVQPSSAVVSAGTVDSGSQQGTQ